MGKLRNRSLKLRHFPSVTKGKCPLRTVLVHQTTGEMGKSACQALVLATAFPRMARSARQTRRRDFEELDAGSGAAMAAALTVGGPEGGGSGGVAPGLADGQGKSGRVVLAGFDVGARTALEAGDPGEPGGHAATSGQKPV